MTLDVAKVIPDVRKKPLLAVVRGQGGGKSRCIEELKLSLNSRENVLALAITFNHKTVFNEIEIWDTNEWDIFSALLHLSRIASSFYEENFTDILIRIKNTFSTTIKPYGQSIKTLVILVEEVMKFEEIVKTSKVLNMADFFEANSVLRSALLNEYILGDRIVNVALVVSSLQIKPLGKSTSGREIEALELPESLNPNKLIKLWIARNVYKDLDNDTIKRFEFFATSINSNPRMCEQII
eukprot:gene20408-26485_t